MSKPRVRIIFGTYILETSDYLISAKSLDELKSKHAKVEANKDCLFYRPLCAAKDDLKTMWEDIRNLSRGDVNEVL